MTTARRALPTTVFPPGWSSGAGDAAAACGIRFWQRALTKRSASLLPDRASCSVAQLQFWNELVGTGVPQREAVRFIAASQPHAGDVLNAIPMRSEFRVPSWAMRVIVQRRLGLPLPRRVSRARCADVHGARRQGAGPHGRRGLEHRTRRPQPAPCGRAQAPRAVHAERVGEASRDGAAGSSGVLQRLPPRPHGSRARRGGQAAGRRRQVQGPPLLQP